MFNEDLILNFDRELDNETDKNFWEKMIISAKIYHLLF